MSEFGAYKTLFAKEGTIFDATQHATDSTIASTQDIKSGALWKYKLQKLVELKRQR